METVMSSTPHSCCGAKRVYLARPAPACAGGGLRLLAISAATTDQALREIRRHMGTAGVALFAAARRSVPVLTFRAARLTARVRRGLFGRASCQRNAAG